MMLGRIKESLKASDEEWTALEPLVPVRDIRLAAGMVLGMNFVLIDNDSGTPGDIAALCRAGPNSWQNPLEFGFAVLEP